MNISPSRKAAFEILLKIEKEKAFSSILLPVFEKDLNDKDSSLCHELVLGVLRKKIFLDEAIKKLTKKQISKFDIEVVTALRLGIYQLLNLDKVPAYSAINESVNLVKFARKKSASGLVNAVLRRASKEKISLEFINQIQKISVETSHPVWLIERWIKQFGILETEEVANANNVIPNLSFRLTAKFHQNDIGLQKDILQSIENISRKADLAEDAYIADRFDGNLRELADKGFIYLQDVGSQIIAASLDLKNDEKFLDVCASPGSKATLVGKRTVVDGSNNLIVAGDLYSHRVQILQENALNQAAEFIEVVQYDAAKGLPFENESFDVVLVDAPCTGTGTIRNNPEIRYNLHESDFADLSKKQLTILENASKLVKHGGKLVYSTCSFETDENEAVVARFIDANSEFIKIDPNVPEKFLTDENFARTFPHRDGTDGFFIAVLARK